MTPQDIDYIDQYLRGELSDEEVQVFQDRLNSDTTFRQLYDEVQGVGAASRKMNLERIGALLESEESSQSSGRIFGMPWMRWVAVLVIGVGIWVTYSYLEHKGRVDKVMASYEHVPSYELTRGDEDVDQRKNAYVFYEARRYKEALPYFEQILDQGRRKDSLFYGYALVGAEEFDEALNMLSGLSAGEGDSIRIELINVLK